MAPWRYINSYATAAKDLGVRLIGSTDIQLPTGEMIHVELHFPDFGNPQGTLVTSSDAYQQALWQKAAQAGYSISTFGLTEREECTSDDLAEMLSEWGWAGNPNDKPHWMKD